MVSHTGIVIKLTFSLFGKGCVVYSVYLVLSGIKTYSKINDLLRRVFLHPGPDDSGFNAKLG